VDQHLLTSVAAQLGSVSSRRPPPELLIPAVEAWLRNPAGGTGGTNSMALISLLVEEVNPEELMKQQGGADSQIRRELEVKIGELW